jgi:hypothetical protein
MIVTVLGWKFMSPQEANDSITRINTYYGVPTSPTNVTQNYTMYIPMDMFGSTFYFLLQRDDLQVVLGEPWEFIINII